ncbi:MAG: DnaJ domain-containing protein [Deltaproteobacteria bacterium]|nr:DnaJ domain-containing protein [Deltaproteobacteria bacterium]
MIAFSNKTGYTVDDFQANPQERRILTLIDGVKKLNDIIAEVKLPKEEVYPFIYALFATNIIVLEAKKKKEDEKAAEEPAAEDAALIENLTSKHLQLKSLNYFEVVGVNQDADNGSIKKAYFKLAKEYHPDKYHKNIPQVKTIASDIFTLINTAYNTLSDKKDRKAYEDSLKSGHKQDITQDVANIMSAEIQFQKGKVALSRKDYKSAKEAFDCALKLNSEEGEYKAYLGWTIFNISPTNAAEANKAKELLEEAISLNPNQDKAYYFIGVIYRVEGKIDEAEAAFGSAVKKNPHLAEALSELRLIQMRKKEGKGLFKKIFKE